MLQISLSQRLDKDKPEAQLLPWLSYGSHRSGHMIQYLASSLQLCSLKHSASRAVTGAQLFKLRVAPLELIENN